MRQHQFQLIPPSEEEASIAIRNTLFRDAPSFRDGIVKHPDLYVDYIGVSAAISLPYPLKVIKFMRLPFLLILSKVRRIQHHKFILIGTAMVALCIPLPTWLVLFTRMHYIDIGGFSYISQSIGITPSQD
jgi:hypothetical protein